MERGREEGGGREYGKVDKDKISQQIVLDSIIELHVVLTSVKLGHGWCW